MTKGIYFLEKNVNLLSDIESFFVVNEVLSFKGGCGVLQRAVKELNGRNDIDIVVITDNIVDASCYEALKTLKSMPFKFIVAMRSDDEILRSKIGSVATVISYPFTCNQIEDTIKKMASAPAYDKTDLERLADSNIESDNPFYSGNPTVKHKINKPPVRKAESFQDRLKNIQINRNKENVVRVIPQKVIAVHSQKGGVGKSTISRELAIAVHTAHIEKDAAEYVPKVCLCDFDFEAADIAPLMGIEPCQNIITWCEEIDYESRRSGEPISKIRFTEDIIKDSFLMCHESGVYVLCAPENKTDSFKIESGYVEAIIDNLKLCDFDIILIDTGPNILDYTLTTLNQCSDVYAVCNSDMMSSRRLDSMIRDIFSKMEGFNYDKLHLLVNHLVPNASVTADDLSKVLSLPLVGEIPYFPDIVDINNQGISVFYNRKKSTQDSVQYANSFRSIARKIVCTSRKSIEDIQSNGCTVEGLDSERRKSNFSIFRK